MANEMMEKQGPGPGQVQFLQRRSTAVVLKEKLDSPNIQKRFREILDKKAPQFCASLRNAVTASKSLQACDVNSILGAAFVAATYDLPIDSNLGFSAIVPYNTSVYNSVTKRWEKVTLAQFQMMYKGFIQLAIRSGYYEAMNYAVVYGDELKAYNPITGEVVFVDDFSTTTMRKEGKPENVVGYYAWFKLRTGFKKALYMTREEVENHALKYSQSYRSDKKNNKSSSRWSQDFDVMASKTVIKQLLSKWGILSIEMMGAINDDQKVYNANGEGGYVDNTEAETVDAEVLDVFAGAGGPENLDEFAQFEEQFGGGDQ